MIQSVTSYADMSQKISKAIEIAYQQRTGDTFPPQIARQFCHMPLNAPDNPGDPLLRYKQPMYTSERIGESEIPCKAIVVGERFHFLPRATLTQSSFLA
jgi:hypothetical protein